MPAANYNKKHPISDSLALHHLFQDQLIPQGLSRIMQYIHAPSFTGAPT